MSFAKQHDYPARPEVAVATRGERARWPGPTTCHPSPGPCHLLALIATRREVDEGQLHENKGPAHFLIATNPVLLKRRRKPARATPPFGAHCQLWTVNRQLRHGLQFPTFDFQLSTAAQQKCYLPPAFQGSAQPMRTRR